MPGLRNRDKKTKKEPHFSIRSEPLFGLSVEAVIIPTIKTGKAESGTITGCKTTGIKHIIQAIPAAGNINNNNKSETENALREFYRRAFKTAGELGCKTLGLPFPAWESYNISKETELKVLGEEIQTFILEHPMEVILAVKKEKLHPPNGNLFPEIQNFIESNTEPEKDTEEVLYSEPAPFGAVPVRRKPIHNRREYSPAPKRFLYTELAECDAEFSGPLPETDEIRDFINSAEEELNFQNTLQHLIAERNLDNATVYKKAFIDKKFFSKIITKKNYVPKKPTVMALGLALELEIRQYEDFLASAGYAFMPSSKFDLIIKYCVLNKIYNIISIDLILDSYGLPCFSPE